MWPVSRRNTSSRVGRRIPASYTLIPRDPNSARIAWSAAGASSALTVSSRRSVVTVGSEVPNLRRISVALALSPADTRLISTRWPPMDAFNSSAVPRAITFPSSMTQMLSASRSASSRYCVVSSTVVPSPTRVVMMSHMPRRLRGSSPVVGSSRNRTFGRVTRAPARSMRRRMPPENPFTGRFIASVSSKMAINSFALVREALAPRWYSRPTISRFSKPVRFSSTAAYCPDTPMIGRMRSGCFSTSIPSMTAVPEFGLIRVVNTLIAVVLPAPFGPSKAVTVPSGTERSSPSSACTGGAPLGV